MGVSLSVCLSVVLYKRKAARVFLIFSSIDNNHACLGSNNITTFLKLKQLHNITHEFCIAKNLLNRLLYGFL